MKTETHHRATAGAHSDARRPPEVHHRGPAHPLKRDEGPVKHEAPKPPDPPEVAAPLAAAGMEVEDRRSHIERINRFDNPADGTGAGHGHHGPGIASPLRKPPDRSGQERKPYILLQHAKQADAILPPGTIVMLYEDEAIEGTHRPHEE